MPAQVLPSRASMYRSTPACACPIRSRDVDCTLADKPSAAARPRTKNMAKPHR